MMPLKSAPHSCREGEVARIPYFTRIFALLRGGGACKKELNYE
jgi:hypothetical protein